MSLLTAATLLTANRALLALKLRPRPDAWRRAAQVMLGGEAATFILSAFALTLFSDTTPPANPTVATAESHLARRLHDFLTTEPLSYIRITRIAGSAGDFHRLEKSAAPNYTLRIEPAPRGNARFLAPSNWQGDYRPSHRPTPADLPLFQIVARLHNNQSEADLWLRINHAAVDGLPVQELLSRLQQQWGTSPLLTFPTTEQFAPHAEPRQSHGRADLAECQLFLDFTQLLDWRKRANARLAEPMTTAAAILWQLSHHEPFADIHLGTTADIPAQGKLPRAVGVLTTRPADHRAASSDDGALINYTRHFNTTLNQTRARTTPAYKTLEAAAHLPPRHARALLTHALTNVPATFGAAALTMLKDAHVFGAPIANHGHPQGFLALGNLALPTRAGSTVGSVTIKALRSTIERTKQAVTDAITNPRKT